ncbi:MAG: hypothetical protein SangKO_061240 [Sandaracinaceae bacterium]
MRVSFFLWAGVLVLGCASPTPGWGDDAPTSSGAEAASLPSVASALRGDPAPPPESLAGTEGGHAHHGHRTEAPPSDADESEPEPVRPRDTAEGSEHAH